MYVIQYHIPLAKGKGQGWNLPKFHEQLHIIDDIIWNGAPSGSYSGPLEKIFHL